MLFLCFDGSGSEAGRLARLLYRRRHKTPVKGQKRSFKLWWGGRINARFMRARLRICCDVGGIDASGETLRLRGGEQGSVDIGEGGERIIWSLPGIALVVGSESNQGWSSLVDLAMLSAMMEGCWSER